MDNLVLRVNLKDKSVVDPELTEYLNVHSCGHDNENDHEGKDVGLYPRAQGYPRFFLLANLWEPQEEDEKH